MALKLLRDELELLVKLMAQRRDRPLTPKTVIHRIYELANKFADEYVTDDPNKPAPATSLPPEVEALLRRRKLHQIDLGLYAEGLERFSEKAAAAIQPVLQQMAKAEHVRWRECPLCKHKRVFPATRNTKTCPPCQRRLPSRSGRSWRLQKKKNREE